MSPLGSVLLVEIPEAEPNVGEARRRWDPVAELGIPAHVTALAPFVPAPELDHATFVTIAGVAATLHPFAYRFTETRWFDGSVLFLAPDDPAPFIRLIEATLDAFPDYPRYGGRFEHIHPHLTIGRGDDRTALRAVEATVRAAGPIVGSATFLTLMAEERSGRWSRVGTWALGTSDRHVP